MVPKHLKAKIRHQILFFKEFLEHPTSVGAIIPSSVFLAGKMLGESKSPRHIVELGPGTGAFTSSALKRFPEAKKYWAFEINPTFRMILKQRFPEIIVMENGAEQAVECLKADSGTIDLVISGLPFANIPWRINRKIIDATHEIMREGAIFSTFVYFHTYQLPVLRRMRSYLEVKFSKVEVSLVWYNVPPAFVIKCTR